MPGRDFPPGGFDGPGHFAFGLVWMGLSLLFWLGIPALLVWASLRWLGPRTRGWGAPAPVARPTAVEALAHRYAMGEIDAVTFEQMVERILAVEGRQAPGYADYPPTAGAGYPPPPAPEPPSAGTAGTAGTEGDIYNT